MVRMIRTPRLDRAKTDQEPKILMEFSMLCFESSANLTMDVTVKYK